MSHSAAATLSYAKERVEAILRQHQRRIVLLNADGSIQQTNPAFSTYLGISRTKLVAFRSPR
ncbi:MAG: hypothetical protein U0694_00250 [Anaerolineae bacterium]